MALGARVVLGLVVALALLGSAAAATTADYKYTALVRTQDYMVCDDDYCMATMDGGDPADETSCSCSCGSLLDFAELPPGGWGLAPNDEWTVKKATEHSWGATSLVLEDGDAVGTALSGRPGHKYDTKRLRKVRQTALSLTLSLPLSRCLPYSTNTIHSLSLSSSVSLSPLLK